MLFWIFPVSTTLPTLSAATAMAALLPPLPVFMTHRYCPFGAYLATKISVPELVIPPPPKSTVPAKNPATSMLPALSVVTALPESAPVPPIRRAQRYAPPLLLGTGVAVGVPVGASVFGAVAVGGIDVLVGTGVLVSVAVGGIDVFVGTIVAVLVGSGVFV